MFKAPQAPVCERHITKAELSNPLGRISLSCERPSTWTAVPPPAASEGTQDRACASPGKPRRKVTPLIPTPCKPLHPAASRRPRLQAWPAAHRRQTAARMLRCWLSLYRLLPPFPQQHCLRHLRPHQPSGLLSCQRHQEGHGPHSTLIIWGNMVTSTNAPCLDSHPRGLPIQKPSNRVPPPC